MQVLHEIIIQIDGLLNAAWFDAGEAFGLTLDSVALVPAIEEFVAELERIVRVILHF